jgi:aspartate aminotransferase-like enzyme
VLVVSNGEFGDRLIDHARRHRLDHTTMALPWGEPIDPVCLRARLAATGARWLWAVASETSTGMLNDVAELEAAARSTGAKVCLDAISAVGAVPLALQGVAFASLASGKGLGALPGLSAVVYNVPVEPAPDRLPRYLDLGYYAAESGVPFTQSSNLVSALAAALDRFDAGSPIDDLATLDAWFRPQLRTLGLEPLVPDAWSTPAVVTVEAPDGLTAAGIGDSLARRGLLIAHQSEYLRRRNWFQVSLMGACTQGHLERLLEGFRRVL